MSLTIPRLRVANANFVTHNLAVGGDLPFDNVRAAEHAIDLVDAGVTHVFDVRQEADDAGLWAFCPEVSYRWDGIEDTGQRVPPEWFDGVATWALEALRDPAAKLLTHCHMGINRGPSAGYAVLLALGWDPVEAIDAIRRARPVANVWYAEDALAWHHLRAGTDPETRRADVARMAAWRREHPLDVVRIIAERRRAGE